MFVSINNLAKSNHDIVYYSELFSSFDACLHLSSFIHFSYFQTTQLYFLFRLKVRMKIKWHLIWLKVNEI